MANTELAEKLCDKCAWLREYGGQQNSVYTSVCAGNFKTALNILRTQGGCSRCINLVEDAQ